MKNYCFFTDEFKVNNVYLNSAETKTFPLISRKDNYYFVLVILKGNSSANKNNTSIELFENQMVLGKPNTSFFRTIEKGIEHEFLSIEIQPSFFNKNISVDKELKRPFELPFNDDNLIIDLGLKKNAYILETILNIKKVLSLKLSKDHLLPRFFTLISELCILCDEAQENNILHTNSVPTRLIDYIDHHYLENITYESLSKKFFISKGTILTIINRSTENNFGDNKMTLKDYIYHLRFKDANILLKKGIDATKVASLCGFSTYSTFYRAYKNYFGISPSSAKAYTADRKNWPMTK